VRADVEGNRRGILILTMRTKPTLSFLLLITLTRFFLASPDKDLLNLVHSTSPRPVMSSNKCRISGGHHTNCLTGEKEGKDNCKSNPLMNKGVIYNNKDGPSS
jgi:hypothetical protein